ncbi:MAG: AAA family ATPase [Candidatus Deferrimicrobiaceae bacterium]
MYEGYFHLTARPFSLTPDPEFLFLSASHQQALEHLLYGLETGEGFIVVTGDIGVGKTTVCRALLRRLSGAFSTALVLNPMLTEKELVRGILDDFAVETTNGTKKDYLDALNRYLLSEAERGRRPVLIIDEAQNLSPVLLEQVRLLSNLETEKRKLLQIVLIGQKELKDKLSLHSLRQLNQRVTVRAEILPLTVAEQSRYIDHRLGVAGGAGRAFLSSGAEKVICRRSKGVPRRINMLCDRAFLSSYLRGGARIEREDVYRATESLSDSQGMGRRFLRWVPWVSPPLALLAALVLYGWMA